MHVCLLFVYLHRTQYSQLYPQTVLPPANLHIIIFPVWFNDVIATNRIIHMYVYTYVGQHSIEHKLFADYYRRLVDILPASDLSHYFVSDKIISLEDYKKIMRSSLTQEAAKLLLDRVSVQLQNGNNTIFNKTLLIMDQHGVTAAKELAQVIRSALSKAKCESDVASSSEQSKDIL